MFQIMCTNCGRQQEWKNGSQVGRMKIEAHGSVILCSCGSGITKEAGKDILTEFNLPDYRDDLLSS